MNLGVQRDRDVDLSFARPFPRKTRSLRRRLSAALDRIGQRMGMAGGWSPNGRKSPPPIIGGKIAKPGRRCAADEGLDRKGKSRGRRSLSKNLTIRENKRENLPYL